METLKRLITRSEDSSQNNRELGFDSDSDSDYLDSDNGNAGSVSQWIRGACCNIFSFSLSLSIPFPNILSLLSSMHVLGSNSSSGQNSEYTDLSVASNNSRNGKQVMTPSLLDRIKNVAKMKSPEDKQDLLDKRNANPNYNASSQYFGRSLEIEKDELETVMQQVTINLDDNSDEEVKNAEEDTSNNSNNNTVDMSVYYIS